MGSLKAAVDDLKAAFVSAFYSFAYPLMLTAIYYLHMWAKKQQGSSKDQRNPFNDTPPKMSNIIYVYNIYIYIHPLVNQGSTEVT